jgi:hypothetical protein
MKEPSMKTTDLRIPLQKRIFVRIVGTVLVLTTVILMMMGFWQYQSAKTRLEQGLNVDADLAIQRIGLTLQDPLYNFDMNQAEAILRSEMQDLRLLALALSDGSNQKQILILGRDAEKKNTENRKTSGSQTFSAPQPH